MTEPPFDQAELRRLLSTLVDPTELRRAFASLVDPADRRRFLDDLDRFRLVREHHTLAAERGVRTAPLYRLPMSEQVAHEARRRRGAGDATWSVWAAVSTMTRDIEER